LQFFGAALRSHGDGIKRGRFRRLLRVGGGNAAQGQRQNQWMTAAHIVEVFLAHLAGPLQWGECAQAMRQSKNAFPLLGGFLWRDGGALDNGVRAVAGNNGNATVEARTPPSPPSNVMSISE